MKYNNIKIEKSVDVIYNLLSIELTLFTLYYFNFAIDKEIMPAIKWFYTLATVILPLSFLIRLENCYFFRKTIQIGRKYLILMPCLVSFLGLCELVTQYITMNKFHHIMNIINVLFSVPLIFYILSCYLRNLNKKYKIIDAISSQVGITYLRLYSLLAVSFLCALWGSYERNNFSVASLLINIIYEWVAMVIFFIQCTYMIRALLFVAKNKTIIENPDFNTLFTYPFFIYAEVMIIIWGSVSMFSKTFILEISYLPATAIYTGLYFICGYIICYKKIGCSIKRKDILLAVLTNSIIWINFLFVTYVSTNNIQGDFIAIVEGFFSLIGCVGVAVYGIISMEKNQKSSL